MTRPIFLSFSAVDFPISVISTLAKDRHLSPDLFEFAANNFQIPRSNSGPLAHRMRPLSLDEITGQERVLGAGKPLRVWIETDRVPSLILWGPPGCGKTTLARVIAQQTRSDFESLNAVFSGVKEIKEVVGKAQ